MSIVGGLVQPRTEGEPVTPYRHTGWFGRHGWLFVVEGGIAIWALLALAIAYLD
ncbi:MAG: hypothetical protein KGJ78_01805 [Alphaproteobacteria bacterium]|nr:hypothetical protein [Alphaproteobacteria bacterium]